MNMNNILANVVSNINAGNRHKVKSIKIVYNKHSIELVKKLEELGLIRGYIFESNRDLVVKMRYTGGSSVFYKIQVVSKPSKRVYWDMNKLYKNVDKQNAVIFIISTKEGLVIGNDCLWRCLTGEVIAKILL